MKHFSSQSKNRGAALLMAIFFFLMISIAIVQSASVGAIAELRTYRTLVTSKDAYYAAEAGIEDIYYRRTTNKQVPTSETIVLNGATSTVQAVAVTIGQTDVYATGNASGQNRKLYLSISRYKSVPFMYAAQVGDGGVVLNKNATIDATGLDKGNLYSNGPITGTPPTSITGDVISASALPPDIYASSTVCDTDEVVGMTNPNVDYAESFISAATTSLPLVKASFYIKRVGSPTAANVLITADNAGSPSTTALATTTLSYSAASTNYGWVTVYFASPATLSPNTKYWLVLDAAQNASKYWYWCRSSFDTSATGTIKYKANWGSSSPAWTTLPSSDMAYNVTLGQDMSKIVNVTISGTAKADYISSATVGKDAYYAYISGGTVAGKSYPGSPTPPIVTLPLSTTTIASWKNDAISGGTINGNITSSGTYGPKRINGNITLSNSTLTLSGTLYVTGNMTLDQDTIQCGVAYGPASCALIVDGVVSSRDHTNYVGSGSSGSYVLLISTKTGCTGTTGTGCSTNFSAIHLEDNSQGALFYTTDSAIDVSDNASLTALAGYKLVIGNNSSIHYDSKVSALSVFSVGTTTSTTTAGFWNSNNWNEF